jgi:hypothetical protein
VFLKKFPFSIVYTEISEGICVVAVAPFGGSRVTGALEQESDG